MNSKVAIYPGTFDPITNGHIDVIERAATIFDKVIMAVAVNPSKTPLFTVQERMDMIRNAVSYIPNASVDCIEGLLVDYVAQKEVQVVIRGLRAITDFEYELQMAQVNRKLNNNLITVFMMPHERYSYLNSSVVKEIAGYGGNIECFVPENVREQLVEKLS
ncbi:MAG: pantetheine-phosphate adenylyltransferase [candidate division KSB1 bacterium]|nr:pantetheine-phosphate adenylyltransferase [candidate division KSB1 bacterium]